MLDRAIVWCWFPSENCSEADFMFSTEDSGRCRGFGFAGGEETDSGKTGAGKTEIDRAHGFSPIPVETIESARSGKAGWVFRVGPAWADPTAMVQGVMAPRENRG